MLKNENADFKELAREIINTCDLDHNEKDVLFGKTKILLNEKFKLELDKALDVKQELKKNAVKKLEHIYADFNKRTNVLKFFESESRSIGISRDLLKSWTAKIDGMKFKNFLGIVSRLQNRYRFQKQKRMRRFKAYNMKL